MLQRQSPGYRVDHSYVHVIVYQILLVRMWIWIQQALVLATVQLTRMVTHVMLVIQRVVVIVFEMVMVLTADCVIIVSAQNVRLSTILEPASNV